MSETKTYVMVEGHEIPPTIEGYTIECSAAHEGIDIIQNVTLGVIPLEGGELQKVITMISESVGPTNRMAIANIMASAEIPWPNEIKTGIPAYLEGCAIVKHDGKGGRIAMDIIDPDEEE